MIGSKHRNFSLRHHYNYTNSVFNKLIYKCICIDNGYRYDNSYCGYSGREVLVSTNDFLNYDDKINRFSFIFFYSEENTVMKSGPYTVPKRLQ